MHKFANMLESLAHPYLQVIETALEHLTVPFFGFFFHTDVEYFKKGGAAMDEDNDVFEMFLVMMEQLQSNDSEGRMRMLSKNPRYAADSPGNKSEKTNSKEITQKTKHIERI